MQLQFLCGRHGSTIWKVSRMLVIVTPSRRAATRRWQIPVL